MKRDLFNVLVAITVDRITAYAEEEEKPQLSDDAKKRIAKEDVASFFDVEESDLTEEGLTEDDVTPYLQYMQMFLDNYGR